MQCLEASQPYETGHRGGNGMQDASRGRPHAVRNASCSRRVSLELSVCAVRTMAWMEKAACMRTGVRKAIAHTYTIAEHTVVMCNCTREETDRADAPATLIFSRGVGGWP